MPNNLSENHRHSGRRGDGNKIPARNIQNLAGIEVRTDFINLSTGVSASGATNYDDFSPRFLKMVGGVVGLSDGGQSVGTLMRGPNGSVRTIYFDANANDYKTDTTNIVHLKDSSGAETFGTATIGETGWSYNFAGANVNCDGRVLVEIWGYALPYNRALQDGI